jgi:pantoate--beta-alanine ligase
METVQHIPAVRSRVSGWRREGVSVALVPTMGNLHRGHIRLVELALERAERVVVSIFVNPMQFGPQDDFERYPRTLERDCHALAQAGVQLVFAPDAREMYPNGMERSSVVDVPAFDGILEGSFRPGHFQGVATVVAKLFNIATPDLAVFGQKDYQQLLVIERMTRDLCLPIEIVAAPIARDDDGLALSSRNQYLSTDERRRAPALHGCLLAARQRILDGDRQWTRIEMGAMKSLQSDGFEPDYFSIRSARQLAPPGPEDAQLVLLVAARLGATRLIDNLRVDLT